MPDPAGAGPAGGPGRTGERPAGGDPGLPAGRGRRATPARQALDPARRLDPLQGQRTPQYLVIGHICADLLPDGTAVLGGTALYSALTAARLGLRVGVLTRGAFGVTVDGVAIPSLAPYAGELSIVCQDAERPTVFVNEYQADRRVQQIRHWAGPIDLRGLPPHWRNARVIHLGPIAQEIDPRETAGLTPGFMGATPQGWMREWPREAGGRVRLRHLRIVPELLGRLDAVVVSIEEISLARETVEQVAAHRLGVVTKGEGGARVHYGGETADLPGFPVAARDLTGAGDVFAAAFFARASDKTVSVVNAARFANATAALSLRGVGPTGVPTLAEVEALLAEAGEGPRRARSVGRPG